MSRVVRSAHPFLISLPAHGGRGGSSNRRLADLQRVIRLPPVSSSWEEYVEFRESPIHGMGAFARRRIPAGHRLIEYVGERITKAESARRCEENNPYIFTLDETWDLDGSVAWNPARHINHSCAPNCDAEDDEGRIWIVTRREIEAGEEISFNYGYDLESYQDYPCLCGDPGCVGFMVAEELFPQVRRRHGRRRAGGGRGPAGKPSA